MKHTLDFSKGSNSGTAIYLNDKNGGTRLFGGKCWGNIETIHSFSLTLFEVKLAIKELTKIKNELERKEAV